MNVKDSLTDAWVYELDAELKKDYFRQLCQFVESEYSTVRCYPPQEKIFAALSECPLEKVRAVIIGQDPYHGPGQAEGLSFSVPDGIAFPPSLRNILREVNADTGAPIPASGSLLRWARQGVLLLNTVLTVREGQANSHAGRGWELFTDAIINKVSERCDNVVFFLWGSHAQKKGRLIDESRHLVLCGVHPSPLSAYRGFFGQHQFTQANAYLEAHGRGRIIW